ncbi:MAG: hypothetical protein KAJ23_10900 [Maribacter sp.]|nr:hypothetical protein [Maribacter sp.]
MEKTMAMGVFLLLVGCKNEVSQEDIALLNGYWEIDEVTMVDGKTKSYTVSTTIDYIEIKELSGYRKKVYPKFDGTYDTSNDAEPFTIVSKDDIFEIHYENELSKWVEKIESLDYVSFTVVNEEGVNYTYKRFIPINAKE